jgi:hypothetical protein
VWIPEGGSNGDAHHEDPNLAFPTNCTATLPECGCCYIIGREFECEGGRWGELL